MNDFELLSWLDWYTRGDGSIHLFEEDGGMILDLGADGMFIGTDIWHCIQQAVVAYPEVK